jgi:hypothetical protein
MDPIIHLRRAKEAIQAEGPARGRLQTAGREFWSALFDSHAWPPELQEAAEQLTDLLLANGPIDATVPTLDDLTVQETLHRLSDFCDQAVSFLQE